MIRKRGSRKTEAYLSRDIIEDTDGSDEEDPVDSDKVKKLFWENRGIRANFQMRSSY